MQIHLSSTVAEFLDRNRSFLEAHADHNNLLLGLLAPALKGQSHYKDFFLVDVREDDGSIIGTALRTDTHPLQLAYMEDDRAIPAIVQAVVETFGDTLSGVGGYKVRVQSFAQQYTALYPGLRSEIKMRQALYRLDSVRMPPEAPGQMRPVTPADRDLVAAWISAFEAEAMGESLDEAAGKRTFDNWMKSERRLWLWEDAGQSVCLIGTMAYVAGGARLGPVYTPPQHRQKGYATRMVAEVSQLLLTQFGRKFCVLYTDLDFPTSNKIYMKVGYQRIMDAQLLHFVHPEDQR